MNLVIISALTNVVLGVLLMWNSWRLAQASKMVNVLIDREIKAKDASHEHQYRCEICYKEPVS